LLAGALIEFVHFPVHAAPATIDVVAPHAVRNLVLIYMPLQITLWAIAILMVGGYRIDRATHEDNLRRLSQSALLAEVTPAGMEIAGLSGGLEEVLEPHPAAPSVRVSRGA